MTTRITLAQAALGAAAALVLSGCPNPNTYGTPRTTPAGKLSHSIALETFTFSGEYVDPVEGDTQRFGGTVFLPPTYTLRIGATDELDVGVRVANASSLGADLKLNFVKSDVFDAAIDPGLQWFQLSIGTESLHVVYLHAPLLLGLNVSESVSVVLIPGLTWGLAGTTDLVSATDVQRASSASGAIGRLGLGLDFRISPRFALHPEVTVLRSFDTDAVTTSLFGLGFNFGNLPSFGPEE